MSDIYEDLNDAKILGYFLEIFYMNVMLYYFSRIGCIDDLFAWIVTGLCTQTGCL